MVVFGYAASVGKMRAVGSEGGGDAAAYFHQNVCPYHVVFTRTLSGVALPRIGPARGRVGEQARSGQILQVPFRSALCPPCPEDPPRVRLVSIKLGVNEVL